MAVICQKPGVFDQIVKISRCALWHRKMNIFTDHSTQIHDPVFHEWKLKRVFNHYLKPRSMRFIFLVCAILYGGTLVSCNEGLSQVGNFPLTFIQIPVSEPDLNRPGAGAEQWNDQNTVNIPNAAINSPRLDAYYRFSYTDIAAFSGAPETYDFSVFDNKINDAISNRQKFSFGIMQMCGGCGQVPVVEGAKLFYPLYLHNQMQTENIKDWIVDGIWIPNYNSLYWLSAWKSLNAAVNKHIMNGSFNGIQYRNIIQYIDIRGYGNYGEWTNNEFPGDPAAVATVETLDSIISYTMHQYSDFQCVAMIASFDGNQLHNTMIPPAVGYYALTASNNAGPVGWRRDNWGWTDSYLSRWIDKNPTVFNGFRFDTAINNRYKYAPVVGEPADLGLASYGGKAFGDMPRQMKFYHVNSFGNGNLDKSLNNPDAMDNIRMSSKFAGYRLILTEGNMTPNLNPGAAFNITMGWQNKGAAPLYEHWNVIYELRNTAGLVIWSGNSAVDPASILPYDKVKSVNDHFILPASVPKGKYSLYLIVRDQKEYRQPLPLAISGRNADGSYQIRSNILIGISESVGKK